MSGEADATDPQTNGIRRTAAPADPADAAAWDRMFAELTAMIATDDGRRKPHSSSAYTIERIGRELRNEEDVRWPEAGRDAYEADRRLRPILDAVERRERTRAGAVERFVTWLVIAGPSREALLDWGRGMDERGLRAASLIVQIELHAWGRDYNACGSQLIALLDHEDDLVRTRAAQALAESIDDAADRSALLVEAFALIRAKELVRPGVAGSFLAAARWGPIAMLVGEPSPVDLKEWTLGLLHDRTGDEPDLEHENSLVAAAGSLFEGDVAGIQRLRDAGFLEAAVWAAAGSTKAADGLQELLESLSEEVRDDFDVWALSLTAAELYGVASRRGIELGLVDRVAGDGWHALLLIDEDSRRGVPRIVVLWAETAFDEHTALAWVDRLAPPTFRGDIESDRVSLDDGRRTLTYAQGVFAFFAPADAGGWRSIRVLLNGIRDRWDVRDVFPGPV